VLVGAGDIATCTGTNDSATADLLDGIAGTVFITGDNAYDDGTAEEFANCYHPTWGRHRARTRPTPGNHDYYSAGAKPYFSYFGHRAGAASKGDYSYSLGSWHVVALNSNLSVRKGSAQERWLRDDLTANPADCTVVYWHHPLFSSGAYGGDSRARPIWDALYAAGVDVVVNGHEHSYERFAKQTPPTGNESSRVSCSAHSVASWGCGEETASWPDRGSIPMSCADGLSPRCSSATAGSRRSPGIWGSARPRRCVSGSARLRSTRA